MGTVLLAEIVAILVVLLEMMVFATNKDLVRIKKKKKRVGLVEVTLY